MSGDPYYCKMDYFYKVWKKFPGMLLLAVATPPKEVT
jgi:hypothetical protein